MPRLRGDRQRPRMDALIREPTKTIVTQTITMRIWTHMGKENVRCISDFRVHNGVINIDSDHLNDILEIVECGQPCTISFLVCNSEDGVGRYREHSYRGCTLVKGDIRFQALCIPA